MSNLRSILISTNVAIGRVLSKTFVRSIPGARATYHFLNELIWRLPSDSIVEIEGSKMYLNPHEQSPMRRAFRAYLLADKEPLTTKMCKEAIKEGNIVVDLGANIGYFTLLAARLVGESGKVYAFEPNPTNYRYLLKNIQLNGYNHVTAFQRPVFHTAGMVKLFTSEVETGSHSLRPRHATKEFATEQLGKYIEVEAVVLDEFFADKMCPIDMIKMDIEGAEMAALLGMDKLLRANKDLKMIIEFYPDAIREMGDSPEEFVRKLLEDYGFSMVVMDELRTPTNQFIRVNSVDEVMDLCKDVDKIVNLFLERK